ncbi:GM12337 [Drosophila sechellia]|uniref:GM12337 n=1 Tax=Drosophila sechellia TaxID=7238 RepID=B4I107_DROSE|nr:GM12337 [Drosophila sechellia]
MEDLHLKLGDLPQEVLAALHSMIMGQKLAGSLGETQHHLQHEHHLNHQLNQLNQLSHLNQYHHLSQLNQLSKLHQHLQHKISSGMNLNLDLDHEIETEIEMGLDGLDVDLDLNLNMKLGVNLDMNPEGSITNSTSSTSSTSRSGNKPSGRWRKQPLPDLFSAVMSLVTELKRSVSYPEIIGCLSKRLHREQVELKRHVPHTLHAAVNNGYLKKEGNRYSLLPEVEQAEIMRRNIAAAIRAKELEKEPLSWRRR